MSIIANPLITDFGRQAERQSITKAIFLDRDGVLIYDKEYLAHPDHLELIPGVETLRTWQETYRLIVVTNQSGVARGKFSEERLLEIHQKLLTELDVHGVFLDAIYYCPHHPEYGETCLCRKPNPGMLLAAAENFGLDLTNSWMIGDRSSDIAAGAAASCRTILLGDSPSEPMPTHYLTSLYEIENLSLD